MLCRSNLVRTVWDGDQLLHEISAPASGAGTESDTGGFPASFLGPHHYGRVMYVHGGGIDQPIAVVRSEYSDSLHTGVVYPFANHKGQYDMGINPCVLVQPRSPLLAEHHGEQQIGTDTVRHQIADTTPYEHCIRVEWPGRRSFSSGERRHLWGPAPPWVGSLLYHGKDPSGQMYRRNRFYDASSGRFTQEDPIGIAGGLNVYGYANGDPISFEDPFGLDPCPKGQIRVKEECVPVLTGAPPMVTPSGAMRGVARAGAAIASGRRSFNIMRQARTVLRSREMMSLRAAAQTGRAAEVEVAGRTVLFEPSLPTSGMTLFSEGGFVLGPRAFSSQVELTKTVLHELFRLNTSRAAAGVGAATAAGETNAAFEFAERAYRVGQFLRFW